MVTEKKAVKLGWILYGVLWLLLFMNIANDWLTHKWISPLSILLLVILGGSHLIQWLRGKPIISVEGWKNRLVGTFALTLITIISIAIYTLWGLR